MSSVDDAAKFLASHGVPEPRADAEILLAAALGIDRALLPTRNEVEPERAGEWIVRRARREPTAYILGRAEFYGLEFRVTPAVLIPRPSTETLVERALALRPRRVLDIGTGSGAIAVVLAKHGASIVATDISEAALGVARENAKRHGAEVEFVRADLFVDGDFDLIVSNPPYIPTGEIDTLQPEVRYEPRLALDGGPDGLAVIRGILAARRRPLLLEVGAGQSLAVSDLALREGFRGIQWWRDLAGIDRVLEAT